MKKNPVALPRVVATIAALMAIIAFFLPYISSTEDHAKYIDARANEILHVSMNMTVGDTKNLSLYEYAVIYMHTGEDVFGDEISGYIEGGLFAAVGVFSLFTALAALGKKPILTFILNAFMGFTFYVVNWDITGRNIMPSNINVWGISYYLYYPLAGIIAAASAWMLVEKIRLKKQLKVASPQTS